MGKDKCYVIIKKVSGGRAGYFYGLVLDCYDKDKRLKHTFLKFSYLKGFVKRLGIEFIPKAKVITVSGEYYHTRIDASKDWDTELQNYYKENR